MALLKDPMALFLAAIVVTAMVMPSCYAAQDAAIGAGFCNQIVPCTDNTCKVYCQDLGQKDYNAHCKLYNNCCCL
ncbi:hypothetical protein ZWY2020_045221 [Hordeum vulgare]|nr:hypothetical protein ZWY2020_045221 [Hordeum vulgare]